MTPDQYNAIEATTGRALAEPMPPALDEQLADLIEPHTLNRYMKHGDVMHCIHVAWPVIRDWLRDHPGDLAPPARPPGG